MIAFTDNEGCLTAGKGLAYDLAGLTELRRLVSATSSLQLVLCTGRSAPYSEALLQAVGLQNASWPMICEGGAVLYHPDRDLVEVIAQLPDCHELIRRLPEDTFYLELGKKACLTLYPQPGRLSVPELGALTAEACVNLGLELNLSLSAAAVDLTCPGVDKGSAMRFVAQRCGWDLSQALGFGDAHNDLPMLQAVGWPAAPANATAEVKAACSYVSTSAATRGLIETLDWWMPQMQGA